MVQPGIWMPPARAPLTHMEQHNTHRHTLQEPTPCGGHFKRHDTLMAAVHGQQTVKDAGFGWHARAQLLQHLLAYRQHHR